MSEILAESDQLASISQTMTHFSFNILYQTIKVNDKTIVFILKIINLETNDILSKRTLFKIFWNLVMPWKAQQ